MDSSDVLVLGGGASGLVAAILAAENGDHVCLLEAQNKLGKKILASGNGRCNLMNLNDPVYYGDADFVREVFHACSRDMILGFWKSYGLQLRTTREGLVYPCTFQSSTVMDTLMLALRKNKVKILHGQRAKQIDRLSSGFRVTTSSGDQFTAGRLILSTGSPAQPKLGGNSDASTLLKKFNHKVIPYFPALTPLKTDPLSVSGLAGIRVRCKIQVFTDGKAVHSETGELLFTADGISGICVMQCARFVSPGKSICRLNFIYDMYHDTEDAFYDIMRRKALFPEEDPVTLINGICVPRLAFAVCKQAGLAMRGERNADLKEEQIRSVVRILEGYSVRILDRKGFDDAQVSAGGLDCSDFDPETMRSYLVPGLHATGEALNVDGDCGGFNLMFAWASGILAGRNGRSQGC